MKTPRLRNTWLRIIYCAHMLAPLALVRSHLARLDESTLVRLRALFP